MELLITITFKSSRIARYLHIFVLLLALVALWLCGLNLWIKLLLTIALLCIGMWQYQQLKQLTVSMLGLEQEQWWALIRNQRTPVELVDEQLVLPWLIVLNFRVDESGEKNSGKKYTLALWSDMAHADDLRRLRVLLRNA